ncbi:MAG TPA: PAS domain S-box protein [Dongiaceae bacterium]|nr:PAS domain S-box protein [Dongiaceae bacterium]
MAHQQDVSTEFPQTTGTFVAEHDGERVERFLALCPLPAIVTNEYDEILAVNSPALQLFGKMSAEVIGSQREDYLRLPGIDVVQIAPGSEADAELGRGLRGRVVTQAATDTPELIQTMVWGSRYRPEAGNYLTWIMQPSQAAGSNQEAFSELQANLLDQVSFAVLLVDADGRPFFRNKKWNRWVEDIEVDAAMLRELHDGGDRDGATGNRLEAAAGKTIQQAIGEGNYDQWIEFLVEDGGICHWFEANLRPIAWEGEIFFCVEIADCTKRHEAQDELRHSEERFRDLAEISSDWIWETDADLRLIYISDRFYSITGIAPEEILGKTRAELLSDDARGSIAWKEHWATLQAHEAFRNFQYVVKGRNGEDANLSLSGKPIFDDQQAFTGYRGVGAEITKLIEAEKSKRIFEHRVAHAQRLEALGTLAGGIAHDINNALLPVLNMSKMVAKRLPADSADREKLDIVIDAANHCKVLVKSILDFSRQQDVAKEVCDMTAVLNDAVGMLRSTIPSIVGLEAHLPSQPIRMVADGSQIKQLLINLAKNAADAIGLQAGKIRIDCSVVSDEAICKRLPGPLNGSTALLRLCVADNGQGMDETVRQRVFEPFFTTKPPGEGTGLGLAIAHGAVKSHDGIIDVESKLGVGTSFIIYLPVVDQIQTDNS